MIFLYEYQAQKIKNFDNNKNINCKKNVKKLHYEYFFITENVATIVLLHGWGGNFQSFLPISSAFEGYNVLSVDFCGFGMSDKPNYDFTIFTYADVIVQLIRYLKLKEVILLGHSFGGRVAMILGNNNQINITKIILIDSAGIKPRFNLKKKFNILRYKINKKLVAINLKNKKCLQKFGSVDYKSLEENEKKVFLNIIKQDLSNFAKNIMQNTLIIWGEKDKDTPLYMAKKLHKYIKCSKLFVVKDAGHFSYIDDSLNVIKIIKEFLK